MLNASELLNLCDDNGFLRPEHEWTEEIARSFAAAEAIELTDRHWEILHELRAFFNAFGDSPANRALVNYVKQKLGPEKGNSIYLLQLFPGSPARVGSRIAGLPKPKNCL